VDLLVFEVSGRKLALPVRLVERIVWAVAISPLPHAPTCVDGIIDLRGNLLPVIDLHRRFGLPPKPLTPDQHFIVALADHRTVALRVDRADGLMVVSPEAAEPPERIVPGARHAAALVRTPEGVLVIQDLGLLLSLDEGAQLDAALDRASAGSQPAGAAR
jgi:purine-binding chemotaxis protein CheW